MFTCNNNNNEKQFLNFNLCWLSLVSFGLNVQKFLVSIKCSAVADQNLQHKIAAMLTSLKVAALKEPFELCDSAFQSFYNWKEVYAQDLSCGIHEPPYSCESWINYGGSSDPIAQFDCVPALKKRLAVATTVYKWNIALAVHADQVNWEMSSGCTGLGGWHICCVATCGNRVSVGFRFTSNEWTCSAE